MSKYIIRLDDACEKRDIERWNRIEEMLDQHGIKPLVGIIPHCEDPKMESYPFDEFFWERAHAWEKKGWSIAMHGYNHVYATICGGINPVNHKSEFAGEPYEVQAEKIKKGVEIFREHQMEPEIFFAPSHTFDENTLLALKNESRIRVISDTVANDVYQKDGFTFVPQQLGSVRKLPFQTVTFCYHPNVMEDDSYNRLEGFFGKYREKFVNFEEICTTTRKYTMVDRILRWMYFVRK